MGGRVGLATALAAAVVLVAGGTDASAAWRRLDTVLQNFATPEMARTPDGALHIAYNPRGTTGNDERVSVVNISPGGVPATPVPIVSGWLGVGQPAILFQLNRLDVAWHGCQTCEQSDPLAGLDAASSTDGGTSWSAPARGDASLTGDIAATLGTPDDHPYFAWDHGGNGLYTATTFGAGVQKLPNPDGLNENLATDPATGQVYLNISRLHSVVTVEALDTSAAPTGTPMNVPSLRGNPPDDAVHRIAMTGRPGGGVYLADGFGPDVLDNHYVGVWRVGSPEVTQITDAKANTQVGIAATPDGRLWVFWRGAREHVFAVRSNPSVTRFGRVVDAGEPGAVDTFAPVGSATPSGGLDVVADAIEGASGKTSLYYRRILPALTFYASPSSVTVHKDGRAGVTFTVTDAGDPVPGARVRVGSATGRTDSKGKVTLRIGAGRSTILKPTAAAAGHITARTKLEVKVVKHRR